jgi:succinate-semialdehyde dehydrogenase / glutarate-semialdehyde dehydrogenase
MGIMTVNPATGEVVREFDQISDSEIEQKILKAGECFSEYRGSTFSQRAGWMRAAADILTRRKEELGALVTLEMGKTIQSSISEIEKSAWVCRYYADNAELFLKDSPVETDATRSFVRYQPLGVILAVMPWNYPFWQVFRFIGPSLMAGNVGLLKHASNVPQSALAIESILLEAGFPEGAFQTLLIPASKVAQVVAHPLVKAATLTGSEGAGISLAGACAAQLKKTVLELGGSDPFIVMPGADIDEALSTAVTARMINNGQACIAAKRFIIHEAVYDDFLKGLTERYRALKVGDPMDPETDLGPLSSAGAVKELEGQVEECLDQGGRLAFGGEVGSFREGEPSLKKGYFYPPTIIADLPAGAPMAQQEFFGPVALVFRVSSSEEAVELANGTDFGLGASVWTRNEAEAEYMIGEIEAGSVFLNGMVKSDPRLPFGGIKRSGYGRELGVQGIMEFVNVKTVWMR